MYKKSDEIRVRGLKIYASHGVLESEKENGQNFYLNLTFRMDTHSAGINDNLEETINYAEACEVAAEEFTKCSYDLIEAATENLARALLIKYPVCDEVEVEVNKPEAPIDEEFENVSVCITRGWHDAYIAVGSNLGDSYELIEAAKKNLSERPEVELIKEATLISTKPYGVIDQPDFVNGMWKIRTVYEPFELLEELNKTEALLGRQRLVHWGPRTIDLDIIYYDDLVIDTQRLTVPHIDMSNRTFVLEPLNELDPFVRHPLNGMRAGEMLNLLDVH